MKIQKQICKCKHKLDDHLEQINGKTIAGECIKCNCCKYAEFKHKTKREQ